jgi:hypothetical protein
VLENFVTFIAEMRRVLPQATYDGKEYGRTTSPVSRVALPEIFGGRSYTSDALQFCTYWCNLNLDDSIGQIFHRFIFYDYTHVSMLQR